MVNEHIKAIESLYIFVFHASQRSGLFKITNAAITPGTQPHKVNKKTITIEPHPWSITAKGGKRIDKSTRQKLKIL